MSVCTVPDCAGTYHARGLCHRHYQAARYQPAPVAPMDPPHATMAECGDRWVPLGCPHFSDAHVEALKAAGQWPTTANPVWPQACA